MKNKKGREKEEKKDKIRRREPNYLEVKPKKSEFDIQKEYIDS